MESQKELQTIIDNPQYVGSGQRTQQANRIARIDEERQRILRDIGREEDLVATIAKIKTALEQKILRQAIASAPSSFAIPTT